ncbi:helix-turn-helix domain-containing protein [Azonexus sp. IMCC34842]|uniref:helix-turn-helix domain-containing protein n=1 Tax=Azonexus sp. IMCC34842 TaxID=3420950 RepID=UPI003D13D810
MSLDATRWVWQQQGLRPLHKLVMLALADMAGYDNTVWPSHDALMKSTGVDRKTIWQAIKVLREIGHLVDTGDRRGRTGQIPVFRLASIPKTEGFQKGIDSENGTVPLLPGKDSENGIVKDSENGIVKDSENGIVKDSENGIRNLEGEPTSEPTCSPSPSESVDDGFATFWEHYPKKVAKPQALKGWKKIKPAGQVLADLMASLDKQKVSADWLKDGGQFIPHPASWLNGRRWEDETPQAAGQTAAPARNPIFAGAI